MVFAYDADDRLIEATDRNGRVRSFDYDAVGRLSEEDWLDSLGNIAFTIDYAYDAQGRLASASDADSTITYTYDANGFLDVVTTTGTAVGSTIVVDYSANIDGSIASATVSVNGVIDHVEEFSYDAEGRLVQVTQHGGNASEKRVDFTYYDDQRFATITRYADLAGTQLVANSTFTYTDHGQLSALVHAKGAGELAAYAWTYTDSGRVASFVTADNTANYAYDATGQLVGVDNSNISDLGYSYDASGNRTGDDYATSAGNVLTSGAGWSYEYDAEGNQTRKLNTATGESVEYAWDYRNRLTEVRKYDASHTLQQSVEFDYDALNQRIGKVVRNGSGVVTAEEHYVLEARDLSAPGTNGGVQSQANLDDLAAVIDGNGQVVERYMYGSDVDQVLAVETGAGTRWLLTDNLGSVRAEVVYNAANDATSIVKVIDYDAYGNKVSDSNSSVKSRFGYTGREFDSETGLQFNRARYYDPATGRWVSQDPKGFVAGDVNLYRYVGNGPVNATDPSGLSWLSRYSGAVAEGLVDGAKNIATGAGNATIELGQIARDTGNATIGYGSVLTDGLFDTGLYEFDLHSKTISGYDEAVKNGTGDAYARNAMADGATFGIKPLIEGVIDYAKTGDATRASETAGGVFAGNVTGIAIIKVAPYVPVPRIPVPRIFRSATPESSPINGASTKPTIPEVESPAAGESAKPNIPEVEPSAPALKPPAAQATPKPVWEGPKIQSGIRQKALRDRSVVDQIKKDMLADEFDFDGSRNLPDPNGGKYPLDGRVGGWKDPQGNYYLGEGHHRMIAAMEIFEETGNATFVNKLLEFGTWDPFNAHTVKPGPLPR